MRYLRAYTLLILWITFSCSPQKDYQFELINGSESGLNFVNKVEQKIEFNFFDYMYFFNGAGVGAGDFNNDGLVDLIFTSNQGTNSIFLNQGGLKFKDVTEESNIGKYSDGWSTGVSLVDINNDGLLDIYISKVGDYKTNISANQLFVCVGIENGVPLYEDKAIEYDLDLVGFGTQAAFFDYDLDGDLDMFQLNHSIHQNGTFGPRKGFLEKTHPTAGDKLLENREGKFVDVTQNAGILSNEVGYGLGIVISDINLDGWPDIYIGNDFHENDYLYINQRNGSFKELGSEQLSHTSRFSMGVDAADLNNDALPDIISLDMHPYEPAILKSSLGEDPYDIFSFKKGFGYQDQYARNNLQINNGNGTFSEIGMFANIHATDWSWSPLIIDFDNNGVKDLFISNGIPRRMNDIDYLNFMNNDPQQRQRTLSGEVLQEDLELVNKMPSIKIQNQFLIQENLTFSSISHEVKNNEESYSNGAIAADLDNDGDLEIITNNLEDTPFIYKNLSKKTDLNQSITVRFKGSNANLKAIGAKVIIRKTDGTQVVENNPVRGFLSSSLTDVVIGIGNPKTLKDIILVWPDNGYQIVEISQLDSFIDASWRPDLPKFNYENFKKSLKSEPSYNFEDITVRTGLDFNHEENTSFVEFNREPLIPYAVSTEGPALAIGDVNNDGLEDIFIGNAKRNKSKIYIQTREGQFYESHQLHIDNDSIYEDVDALFVDIDNDQDLDLIVTTGGNEFWPPSEYLQQRLYINDGFGNFVRNKAAFSEALLTASTVSITDFNNDGLPDVFFGARAVPKEFGETPNSYMFLNLGDGSFKDITNQINPNLQKSGLVTDSQWVDIDNDNDEDLILSLDWGHIKLFENSNQKLIEKNITKSNGWWNMIYTYDFDRDGDLDIVAGNVGLNNKLKPSESQPVSMYVNDFDSNGQKEQLITYYVAGEEIPFASHAELTKQIPLLKKKYLYAQDFAKAKVEEIFGKEALGLSTYKYVNNASNMILINDGNNNFEEHPLPNELQLSAMRASVAFDFNNDGNKEVFIGGNFYETNVAMGKYNGSFGNIMAFQENEFQVNYLNVNITGQVRNAEIIYIGSKPCLILAKNNEPIQVLEIHSTDAN